MESRGSVGTVSSVIRIEERPSVLLAALPRRRGRTKAAKRRAKAALSLETYQEEHFDLDVGTSLWGGWNKSDWGSCPAGDISV